MASLRKSNYKIERRSPRQIYKREVSSLRSNSSSRSWSSQRDIRLTSRNENRGRSIVRSPVQWNQGAKVQTENMRHTFLPCPYKKVYIGGLRRDSQESEIKDIFTDFGKVCICVLHVFHVFPGSKSVDSSETCWLWFCFDVLSR